MQIQVTGLEDFASCSGDERSVSLITAIYGISCEICGLAVDRASFVDDFCDFVEVFVFLTQTINLVVLLRKSAVSIYSSSREPESRKVVLN